MSMWIMYFSLMTMFIKHPVSMSFILMVQTILISMNMSLFYLNFWFSYMLMLILIGGMLILFMYMTSIASNEKFKFNKLMLIPFFIIMLFQIKLDFFNNFFLQKMDIKLNFSLSMSKFYYFPKNLIIILLIIYLLITMIACIKICKINKGPLRQNF